ncbi:hypothetical protein AQJ27_46910 [Streptomyces olivochromogenes]|nr:hypothetical protein AQJ27_46910 [Streptomyces olivochromogenes]
MQEAQRHLAPIRIDDVRELEARRAQNRQRLTRGRQERPTSGSRQDAATDPMRQRGADRVVDPAHGVTHGRLRNPQPLCRPGEVLLLQYDDGDGKVRCYLVIHI